VLVSVPSSGLCHTRTLTEVVKNRPKGGGLDKVEETENDLHRGQGKRESVPLATCMCLKRAPQTHPVSQPLLVIILGGRLQSLDAQVSGDSPSDQVGQGRSQAEEVEEDEEDESASKSEDTVDLGDTGLGFDPVEDGVLSELRAMMKWCV